MTKKDENRCLRALKKQYDAQDVVFHENEFVVIDKNGLVILYSPEAALELTEQENG